MTKDRVFTPLNKEGTRRLRFKVSADAVLGPRGIGARGKEYTVTTTNGRILRAKVVSCGLPTCFCDAQLI